MRTKKRFNLSPMKIIEIARKIKRIVREMDGGRQDDLINRLCEYVEDEVSDLKIAYGNCEKCYGKGYGTSRYGAVAGSDTDIGYGGGVIDPVSNKIVFCSCERGKQLEEHFKMNIDRSFKKVIAKL